MVYIVSLKSSVTVVPVYFDFVKKWENYGGFCRYSGLSCAVFLFLSEIVVFDSFHCGCAKSVNPNVRPCPVVRPRWRGCSSVVYVDFNNRILTASEYSDVWSCTSSLCDNRGVLVANRSVRGLKFAAISRLVDGLRNRKVVGWLTIRIKIKNCVCLKKRCVCSLHLSEFAVSSEIKKYSCSVDYF